MSRSAGRREVHIGEGRPERRRALVGGDVLLSGFATRVKEKPPADASAGKATERRDTAIVNERQERWEERRCGGF